MVKLEYDIEKRTAKIMKKYFATSTWPLWLAFLLPCFIMGTYFATRQMMPFGNSTILTVDLGQQYVDMFAALRNTLFHHPATFFYSFSNALGGDMLGLWTYYLMSPLNLLLLFFSPANLPTGILLLTILKYGLASLSMAWALRKLQRQTGWLLTTFGIMYALMGWMIAYQLNLLWLDALILLPIIIVGLERLLLTGKYRFYVIPLTLMLMINYYMGYMIAIFLILYWLWTLSRTPLNRHILLTSFKRFSLGSLLSGGLAAVILLPTAFQLTLSKGQYNTVNLGPWVEYNPLWILSKLFIGSFNFDQMPTGQPNIFVASIGMFGALLYFMNHNVSVRNRLVAGVISLFMLASMCLAPLDVFWHAMQFPVWYPYRFSFLWSFWVLWLAAPNIMPKKSLHIKNFSWLLGLLLITAMIVALTMRKTNFMTAPQLLVGLSFALISLALLLLPRFNAWSSLVLLLVLIETSTNAVWSLNNFSYLTKGEYQTEVRDTHKAALTLPSNAHQFYRVGQTYARTKGDPFMQDYYGGSAFSSAFSKQTSDFMGAIGNPSGDNYSTYSNGTMLTDNLLGFKYFFDASTHFSNVKGAPALMATTQRPDLISDDFHQETPAVTVYQNPHALPIGFAASSQALATKFVIGDPIANQTMLWANLLGLKQIQLFKPVTISHITTSNTATPNMLNNAFLTPKSLIKPTTLTATFTPTSSNPYYLTIGPSMTPDNVSITLNGQFIHTNDAFRNPIVLNIANQSASQPQTLVFTLKKSSLLMQDVHLYELNLPKLTQQTEELATNPWHVTKFNQRQISGTITTTRAKSLLMTSIPQAPGWHAVVDGQKQKTTTVANMFLAIPLAPGTHTITITYTPPYLWMGALISSISGLIALAYSLWQQRKSTSNMNCIQKIE